MVEQGLDAVLYFMANAVMFYANKRCIAIFVSEECRWKHMFFLYAAAWLGTGMLGYIFPVPACKLLANIAALFFILLPYETKWPKKIFVVFIVCALNVLIDIMLMLIFTGGKIKPPVPQIYACGVSLAILAFVLVLERTVRTGRRPELPTMYTAVLAVVPAISIVCLWYGTSLRGDKKAMAVTAASFLLINTFVFYLYHFLNDYYADRMEKQMLEQTIQIYRHQLDVIQESQERVNELRHDMKHHMIELKEMVKEVGGGTQLVQYLDDMKKFMLNPEEKVSSGNRDVDGLLNYLLKDADKILAQTDIKLQIPPDIYEKNFDICVILGNLVENAVQAAKQSEEKYLLVHMRESQGVLMILVENSYSGAVKKEHSRFCTSKENASAHGFGLESVKKVVAQNEGDMDISYTEDRFRAEVLLYLR